MSPSVGTAAPVVDIGFRREIEVGELVYPAYTPARAGKVVEVRPGTLYREGDPKMGRRPDTVVIRMPNGKTYETSVLGVRSFPALVEEHRRKLATHEAALRRLEEMP